MSSLVSCMIAIAWRVRFYHSSNTALATGLRNTLVFLTCVREACHQHTQGAATHMEGPALARGIL